ncbi:MAG: AbrB/MazE/SpoVT family DNA-binding domain-containing protein [Polaromonas sp.]
MLQMKMSDGGRVVIPVEIRQALDLKEGDAVLWELRDGEASITTRAQRIRQAQALVRKHVPAGQSLADELIAERKAEAAHG